MQGGGGRGIPKCPSVSTLLAGTTLSDGGAHAHQQSASGWYDGAQAATHRRRLSDLAPVPQGHLPLEADNLDAASLLLGSTSLQASYSLQQVWHSAASTRDSLLWVLETHWNICSSGYTVALAVRQAVHRSLCLSVYMFPPHCPHGGCWLFCFPTWAVNESVIMSSCMGCHLSAIFLRRHADMTLGQLDRGDGAVARHGLLEYLSQPCPCGYSRGYIHAAAKFAQVASEIVASAQ